MDKVKKVVVLPCSGIGKAYGALARETAYELAERVRPGVATLTCLPLLVINDPAARQLVTENPVIAIDGCPKECARKSVEALGKKPAVSYQAIRFYTAHKDLKPEGVAQLNGAGQRLAKIAADELAETVDRLAAQETAAQVSKPALSPTSSRQGAGATGASDICGDCGLEIRDPADRKPAPPAKEEL